ncbi:MAG: hypothetical protein PHR35_22325 [Kiritimatiellae bacterium]|nr:hypothetical protein [Kiritimatiellia bacterium]
MNRFRVVDLTTGTEADLSELVLAAQHNDESWARDLIYCDMEGFAVMEDGTLLILDECGNVAYAPEGRFQVVELDEKGQIIPFHVFDNHEEQGK